MNAGKIVIAGVSGGNSNSTVWPSDAALWVCTKYAPASYLQTDLEGTWQMNELVSGPDSPYWQKATFSVNSAGAFTVTSSTDSNLSTSMTGQTGKLSIKSNGVISCSGACAGLSAVMDAGKTFWATAETNGDGSGKMLIFTKSAAGSLTVNITPPAAVNASAM